MKTNAEYQHDAPQVSQLIDSTLTRWRVGLVLF